LIADIKVIIFMRIGIYILDYHTKNIPNLICYDIFVEDSFALIDSFPLIDFIDPFASELHPRPCAFGQKHGSRVVETWVCRAEQR